MALNWLARWLAAFKTFRISFRRSLRISDCSYGFSRLIKARGQICCAWIF